MKRSSKQEVAGTKTAKAPSNGDQAKRRFYKIFERAEKDLAKIRWVKTDDDKAYELKRLERRQEFAEGAVKIKSYELVCKIEKLVVEIEGLFDADNLRWENISGIYFDCLGDEGERLFALARDNWFRKIDFNGYYEDSKEYRKEMAEIEKKRADIERALAEESPIEAEIEKRVEDSRA